MQMFIDLLDENNILDEYSFKNGIIAFGVSLEKLN